MVSQVSAGGATSGAWKRWTYTDPTPARSLGVNPQHLRGTLPPGRAPIMASKQNIPIVVVDNEDDWGAWNSRGQIPGWQRLGDDPNEADVAYSVDKVRAQNPGTGHRAPPEKKKTQLREAQLGYAVHDQYQVSSGGSVATQAAEGNAYRSRDHGAVAGKARGPGEPCYDTNVNAVQLQPKAGSAGYAPGIALGRGSNGLPLNNPEGIPGHDTPRDQRFQGIARRFGVPNRLHNTHTLYPDRAWTAAPQTLDPNDLFGSPYDSGATTTHGGGRTPERYNQTGMWDEVPVDMPLSVDYAGATEDDAPSGYGGF
jgi:hypothetical protein